MQFKYNIGQVIVFEWFGEKVLLKVKDYKTKVYSNLQSSDGTANFYILDILYMFKTSTVGVIEKLKRQSDNWGVEFVENNSRLATKTEEILYS